MDNIEKLWCHWVTTNEKECGKTISCSYNDGIACYVSDKNYLCSYHHHNLNSIGSSKLIYLRHNIKRIHYLSFYDNVFAATDFDLYMIRRDTFQLKFSYVVPKPISDLCWNPAEDILAVTYYSDEIALYSFSGSEFEPTCSAALHSEIPPSKLPRLWKGPDNAKTTDGDRILSVEPPRIAWQNKGERVAVNFYSRGKRFIQIFDKHLNSLWMTKDYINLEHSLSFSPHGMYLASSAVRLKINTVVLFEKNCLKWEVFNVPFNKGIIKDVKYHPVMNLLAVYSIDVNNIGYLNLYLQLNAKWYLKQQLVYPPSREVRHFQWILLPELAFTICKLVVFTAKNIEYHTFRFIVNRRPNSSMVANVNGNEVDFYDFLEKIVPAPLRQRYIKFNRPINNVLFHPTLPVAILLDSNFQGYMVDLNTSAIILSTSDLDLGSNIAWFHDVDWNTGTEIQLNIVYDDEKRITYNEGMGWTLRMNTFQLASPHYLLRYNDTNCLISYKLLGNLFSSMMYITRKIVEVDGKEITLDFSMSSNEDIYVNDKLLFHGATSLYIYKSYMLFTTTNCRLFCIRIIENIDLFTKELDPTKLYSRAVELGARIVNAGDDNVPQIILGIPRGNLEVICCKLMSVDVIEQYLSNNKWNEAIWLMRTAKINWNVLVDLNPQRFLNSIPDFVKGAEYCSLISGIVNEFGTIDESYLLCLPKTADPTYNKPTVISKVLEYLISTNCASNLVPIVTIQEKHVSLRAALNSIRCIFEKQVSEYEAICKRALNMLMRRGYKLDIVQAVYSFYDLDFVNFFYEESGEDPKVYKPEIENLQSMGAVEQRFCMTVVAGEYTKALKYLMRCANYDIVYVEEYIVEHELEAYAYAALADTVEYYDLIGTLYANKLTKERNYTEAGFVLKRINKLPEALETYKKALDWQEVMIIMSRLNYDQDLKKVTLNELADDLVKAHRVDEAVQLMENYNKDYEKAIKLLVENKAFKKAIMLATVYGKLDLLEKTVLPHIKKHIFNLFERICESKMTFESHTRRLKTIREEREIALNNIAPGLYELDVFSDPGSTASVSSRSSKSKRSSMSSKNRRKEEKKKIDIREGGPYEDIAIIRALYLLYIDVFSMGKEVREIGLISEFEEQNLAKLLQRRLTEVQDSMKKEIPEIWPDVFVTPPQVIDNSVLAVIQNKADLDPQFWGPPPDEILNTKWKLEMFFL